jgi:formate--tetrahydrofolate ligase
VAELLDARSAGTPVPRALYEPGDSFQQKLEKIARRLYGARSVVLSSDAERDLERFTAWGFEALPPCIAKTPLSLSDDASRAGTATGFDVRIDAVRLSAGAGFLVALSGGVQTMPGLPRDPAAKRIHVDSDGRIVGIARDA